jgi:hypothetical protein
MESLEPLRRLLLRAGGRHRTEAHDREMATHTVSDFDVYNDVTAVLDGGRQIRGNVVAIDGQRLLVSEYVDGDQHLVDPARTDHL